jgi:hypothetical protein
MGWYSNAADLGSALAPAVAYPLAEAIGVESVYRLSATFLACGGAAVLLALRHARGFVKK